MQIIKAQSGNIGKAWGVQKKKDVEYRLIKCILRKDIDEGILLCNTITGEIILLSREEEKMLSSLPSRYSAIMDELIEHYYLVPADYDEHSAIIQLRKIFNLFFKKKNITSYTILPTTCCNARCFYCYEANMKHKTMNENTANDIIEFMKEHCGEEKEISIGWFGGEPTLGIARIDQISKGLADAEIKYKSTMISNGYLFDEETVKKAKELWHLNSIQITLDGTEDVYNGIKAYVGIKDSAYKRVIRNIGLLVDAKIGVTVRMNLDKHNSDNLKNLISELAEIFKGKEYFGAYVWPLFDDCGFKPVKHSEDERTWLINRKLELDKYIRECGIAIGYNYSVPELRTSHCMADNDGSLIIDPEGSFAKCEHSYEEGIGNLKSGVMDENAIADWKNIAWYDECAACPLEPKCVMPKKCITSKNCFEAKRNNEIEGYLSSMEYFYNEWKKSMSEKNKEN